MFYPTSYPLSNTWFSNLSQRLQNWFSTVQPTPATQLQLQAGDSYYLETGSYRLRLLAGALWIPNVGILNAGEQLTLTVDKGGLDIHTYAQQAVVLTLKNVLVRSA